MARLFALLFLLAAFASSVCCVETISVGSQLADGGPTKFVYNPGLEGLNGTQVGRFSSELASDKQLRGSNGPRLFISYTSKCVF